MPEPAVGRVPRRVAQRPVGVRRLIRPLASLRLTLFGFVLLGLAAFAVARGAPGGRWLVAAPVILLWFNLAASLAVTPAFRARPALFGFHVGLLALGVAVGAGQLTRFKGHFEISEGQVFDPAAVITDGHGLFEPDLPPEGAFRQGPVSVNYAPGVVRRETTSLAGLLGGVTVEAGDGRPLIVDGYRFYVTHNKGFSAVLTWEDASTGAPLRGAVHFPSFPRLAPAQSARWETPHGTPLELTLEPRTYPRDGAWRLDRTTAGDRLRVSTPGGDEFALVPGQRLALPGGRLRLEGLGLWMGYRVFYDPSLPWVFSCALVTVVFLAFHVWTGLVAPRQRAGAPARGAAG